MTTPSDSHLHWEPLSKRRLAQWSKLARRKERLDAGQILVEGPRQVTEALVSNAPVVAIVVLEPDGLAAGTRAIIQSGRMDWPMFATDARSFAKLSDTVSSAGVVAIVGWRPNAPDHLMRLNPARVLYCDAISDPGNLGTLIRTAAGLGLDAVVTGEGTVDLTNPKVVRSTAGALFHIPLIEHCSVEVFLDWCRQQQATIVVADPAGNEELTEHVSGHWVVAVGGETEGLDPAWPVNGIERIRIRMHRGVESLNAAVAGAILMDRLCQTPGKQSGPTSVE